MPYPYDATEDELSDFLSKNFVSQPPVSPSKPINPEVVEYIKSRRPQSAAKVADSIPVPSGEASDTEIEPSAFEKYQAEFGPDKLKEAQAAADEKKSGLGWAQFAAGVGDAFAGRSPAESAKAFDAIRSGIDEKTTGAFEKRRAAAMGDIKSKKDLDNLDPNSKASQSFRKMMEAQYPNVVKAYGDSWKDVSAADQENVFRPLKLKEDHAARMAQIDLQKSLYSMKGTPAQQAVDSKYANDYLEWNKSGKQTAEKNLARLYAAKEKISKLMKDSTSFDPSGRVVGRIPEWMKPDAQRVIKQEVQGAAQASLKAALGSQFTEGEGVRIMNASYDETLPPAENLKKIQLAIDELEGHKNNAISMAKEYETSGTLRNYKGNSGAPGSSGSSPKTVIQNGHTYTLNPKTGEYE